MTLLWSWLPERVIYGRSFMWLVFWINERHLWLTRALLPYWRSMKWATLRHLLNLIAHWSVLCRPKYSGQTTHSLVCSRMRYRWNAIILAIAISLHTANAYAAMKVGWKKLSISTLRNKGYQNLYLVSRKRFHCWPSFTCPPTIP